MGFDERNVIWIEAIGANVGGNLIPLFLCHRVVEEEFGAPLRSVDFNVIGDRRTNAYASGAYFDAEDGTVSRPNCLRILAGRTTVPRLPILMVAVI
jgi:hypothetical protein